LQEFTYYTAKKNYIGEALVHGCHMNGSHRAALHAVVAVGAFCGAARVELGLSAFGLGVEATGARRDAISTADALLHVDVGEGQGRLDRGTRDEVATDRPWDTVGGGQAHVAWAREAEHVGASLLDVDRRALGTLDNAIIIAIDLLNFADEEVVDFKVDVFGESAFDADGALRKHRSIP